MVCGDSYGRVFFLPHTGRIMFPHFYSADHRTDMRGKVNCRFTGGPRGDELLTLSAMVCQDTINLVSDTWIAQGQDGSFAVMEGRRTPRAPWISFTRDIYEKIKPVVPGNVSYQFIRTEQVNRCENILAGKGRRCGNEAENNSRFCRVHQPAT